jgi:hypothetical protein
MSDPSGAGMPPLITGGSTATIKPVKTTRVSVETIEPLVVAGNVSNGVDPNPRVIPVQTEVICNSMWPDVVGQHAHFDFLCVAGVTFPDGGGGGGTTSCACHVEADGTLHFFPSNNETLFGAQEGAADPTHPERMVHFGLDTNNHGLFTFYTRWDNADDNANAALVITDSEGGVVTLQSWLFGAFGDLLLQGKQVVVSVDEATVLGINGLDPTTTKGMVWIPKLASAPTGVLSPDFGPDFGAIVLDFAGSKLWAWMSGTWKSVTLT